MKVQKKLVIIEVQTGTSFLRVILKDIRIFMGEIIK